MSEWIASQEALAYGELQLKPWEFWRLTPREFRLMLEGFRRRQDRRWGVAAWLALHIRAPYEKKNSKTTVETLLGRTLELMPPVNRK